jgi:hypothetical protein
LVPTGAPLFIVVYVRGWSNRRLLGCAATCIAMQRTAAMIGGLGMSYQDLQRKMAVLREIFGFGGAKARHYVQLARPNVKLPNVTTYQRHINSPTNLRDAQKQELVEAACAFLKDEHQKTVSSKIFSTSDIFAFGRALDVTAVQVAQSERRPLPTPEICARSLYQSSEAVAALVGHYLLFRHNRDDIDPAEPYIQVCAEIIDDGDGRFQYKDYWAESGTTRPAYTGFVFCVGAITNIVGENARANDTVREIWWCGLERFPTNEGEIKLFGYVSDLRKDRSLFADRIVMVRVSQECWQKVRSAKAFYTDRARVVTLTGNQLADFLDSWRDIDLSRPHG